ncbi:S41 family peptidase [Emticicia sp. TH156]|uniref:S41 family peptidase n=1 Tax=Emticicia sp. TH156 TaxID=2067454 RepID=UPI001303F61E|nr:S41 family peptidase [Emticicia sp. TH156]
MDDTLNLSPYKYFNNLAKLMIPIQDSHLGLVQLPEIKNNNDSAAFQSHSNWQKFEKFPQYSVNIDSLKTALLKKTDDSVEGIYYYDNYYSVGVLRVSQTEYIGIVIETKKEVNHWKTGQIAMHLYEYKTNYFKAVYAHPVYKNFMLYNNERYANHSLINSHFYQSFSETVYRKVQPFINYYALPKESPMFQLKSLSDSVQYLLIRNFSANQAKVKKSNAFCDSIQHKLNTPSLILDLRNNEGGAAKVSSKFRRLLKKYAAANKVYVLVNNATVSQGEIFTLQLKSLKNVRILGQTTKGMITYGSNYGRWEILPGKQFAAYLTDMRGVGKGLLPYENIGIKPDIELNNDSDWIGQTLIIIKKDL